MFNHLFSRKRTGTATAISSRAADIDVPRSPSGRAKDPLELAYWLLLWRAPSETDKRYATEAAEAGQELEHLHQRLLASTEFRALAVSIWEDLDPRRSLRDVEAELAHCGDHELFVELAYRALLGRQPDSSGHAFYSAALAQGLWRTSLLKTLIDSAEFKERFLKLCPQGGFVPRDVQLCELANPAKWANPEWMALLTSLAVVPADRPSMHRKGYELTQLLFGLQRLGFVRDDVQVLSVGAGHEPVLYWLANHVRRVIATDLYGGVWQVAGAREGDAGVLEDPLRFAPFPYREDRLVFLKLDGRHLAFRDAAFDVVYSLSSIEHFGAFEGARLAMDDMVRVLKPGGVLALATEYCLAGPPHHEAFQPEQVHALLDHPSLSLVQPIDERVWDRYECQPVDLRTNPYQMPNMVVTDLGSIFTSVMVFLRKQR